MHHESTKFCRGCGETKPREAFSKSRRATDGLQSRCKACQQRYETANRERRRELSGSEAARQRRQRYYQANKEKRAEYNKRYQEENREKVAAQRKRHYVENRERLLAEARERGRRDAERKAERSREWREQNPERFKAACKAWSGGNPDKVRAIRYRRRARERAAKGSVEAAQLRQMYEDQDGLCAYCERELHGKFDADHMVPLSRGGSNNWDNIALACASCNSRKNTKTAEEFWEVLCRS